MASLLTADVKDIKNIIKKSSKKQSKKAARFSEKKGINLIQNQEKNKHLMMTVLIAIVAVLLLEVGFKYGVLDLYTKLNTARDQYNDVHVQYVAAQNQLTDYDDVLLEYRTYSMDWMENDTSGKYVSVNRREVLDVIETDMMKLGTVRELSIKGNTVNIQMTGMNLKEISAMCAELETRPIVKSAVLMSAQTIKDDNAPDTESVAEGSNLAFNIRVIIQSADKAAK